MQVRGSTCGDARSVAALVGIALGAAAAALVLGVGLERREMISLAFGDRSKNDPFSLKP